MTEGVLFEMDTCAFCRPASKRGDVMKRFKACKLLSVQNTLKRCLKYTENLEKEMSEKYHVPFEHKPVNKSTLLKDDLIPGTYANLQTLFLLEQKAVRYNIEYYLDTSVGQMSPHLHLVMCQLGTVLRSGHLYRDKPYGIQCRKAEFIPKKQLKRKGGINSIVDCVLNSTYLLKLTIASINEELENM